MPVTNLLDKSWEKKSKYDSNFKAFITNYMIELIS
jgi:hypothetical protein